MKIAHQTTDNTSCTDPKSEAHPICHIYPVCLDNSWNPAIKLKETFKLSGVYMELKTGWTKSTKKLAGISKKADIIYISHLTISQLTFMKIPNVKDPCSEHDTLFICWVRSSYQSKSENWMNYLLNTLAKTRH